ncbi:MAG: YfbM family protein [Armatimonadota bacterium]
MGCRGVFFALSPAQAERLLAASSGEEVLEIVQEELEERWDEEWLQETDQAWDAIHRCLTDGTLSFAPLSTLHQCVLGGRQLYDGDDYIVSFLSPAEVKEVAAAIQGLDRQWLRGKYFRIDPDDYGLLPDHEDFDYTWEWFQGVQAFYQKVAAGDRPVIFTADQ